MLPREYGCHNQENRNLKRKRHLADITYFLRTGLEGLKKTMKNFSYVMPIAD
jgi:hypothetical protein